MKTAAVLLALGAMLTVEQRDAHRSSHDPPSSAVSADGRFVAFTTYSQLVPADVDHSSDVYVLDRTRQQVTLESPDTAEYQGDCSHPGISGDGRFIIFERSNAVVLHDRTMDVTTILGEGRQPFYHGERPRRGLRRGRFRSCGRRGRERREQGHLFCRSRRRSGTARQCGDAGAGRADGVEHRTERQ